MNYTAGELVKKYLELRTAKENMVERHKRELEPYDNAMQAIEGVMLLKLNAEGQLNAKTEFGTAYKSTTLSATVADRDTWLNYVLYTRNYSLLTNHVSKDAVKAVIERDEIVPPGLNVTQITKVNFRQS